MCPTNAARRTKEPQKMKRLEAARDVERHKVKYGSLFRY